MPADGPADLERLFSPRAVAVVGASANVDSAGHDYVRALREFGFAGAVYPINPRADEVAGYPAFPSLDAVEGAIDLVICCIGVRAQLPKSRREIRRSDLRNQLQRNRFRAK